MARRKRRWTQKKRNARLRPRETWQQYLKRIYLDPRHPGSFQGANKLHQVVQEEGIHQIGLHRIRRWLQEQPSYSLHKPVRRQFRRLKVIVTGIRDQYEADLADMQRLKGRNDGTAFLLVVIDVFSRFMWVEPLKNKSDQEVVEGFRRIFARAPIPRRLRTDRGKEFSGQKSQDYFDTINVEQWAAHNDEMKASFAERAIRTLKSKIWSFIRQRKTYRYIDQLQDMVFAYNNTKHRSTQMKPSAVTRGDVERRLWWHLYKPEQPYIKKKFPKRPRYRLKKGDHVRISHKSKTFERAYDEKWTPEIFVVEQPFSRLGIVKYRLNDLKGESVKGTFYEAELQRVEYSDQGHFDVEEVLEVKGRGKQREALVKWRGWPKKFNSWIKHDQLTDYQVEPAVVVP